MKRDMELVRQILSVIEKHEHGFAPEKINLPGCTEEVVGFHIVLMGEAGLLHVINETVQMADSPSAIVDHMTWDGYEFFGERRERDSLEEGHGHRGREGRYHLVRGAETSGRRDRQDLFPRTPAAAVGSATTAIQ